MNTLPELLTNQELYSAFVPLLSVIVAAVAAFFSYKSAQSSLLAHEAKLLREFSVHYASPDFLDYLRDLRSWLEKYGPDAEQKFFELLSEGDSFAIAVDRARRAVKFHFEDAAKLGKAKYLRRSAVRQICKQAGIDLYFDVAIPLTLALNPEMDLSLQNYLSRMGYRKQKAIRSVR